MSASFVPPRAPRRGAQVMMSHGKGGGFDRAPCTAGRRSPPSEVRKRGSLPLAACPLTMMLASS
jgi:hypothetical protein